MTEKRAGSLEKLLRTELTELKELRQEIRRTNRRLDKIHTLLVPISQKAKEDLREKREAIKAEAEDEVITEALSQFFDNWRKESETSDIKETSHE